MENQNEFMLLFRYEPDFTSQPTEEQMAEMHQQWGAYFGELAGSGKLVSTHQLGFGGKQISAAGTVTEGIVISNNLTIGGNLIVIAEGIDEAVEIAKKCPILLMGGNVEVRDIMPM